VDFKNEGGWTALHFAARNDKENIVRYIINSGSQSLESVAIVVLAPSLGSTKMTPKQMAKGYKQKHVTQIFSDLKRDKMTMKRKSKTLRREEVLTQLAELESK